ncbi:N5-carboxyaminoimidazole ribonucleotide synthase [Devosia pacifica]|uniref:N5-carboxyaminoimidazole ribonucleotide synthase n=1 Tax=Devosia pacifica TaxID=1335967 RepID=A0A918VX73_9HYPH|nr:5-(carboxyamino)imidazole ribonucleotide synthase [Devosia pacifica]GHA38145.1 N5-carboxyaminoimidazole ribonucleotide synthase [Devosia pacifica]
MTDLSPLPQGSTIGILGGGQLGRMLALAAARLGMKTHIFCPDPQSPAFDVTPYRTVAEYTDQDALAAFADAVDVVTYEFENVPVETAEFIASRCPLRPGTRALAVAQDRLAEKTFLSEHNIPITPYRAVHTEADLDRAGTELGFPGVLKTTRLGYDGKGQRTVSSPEDARSAFADLEPKPLVFEGFVSFDKEISVVGARDASGRVRCFEPAENLHQNHILKTSTVPAGISPALAKHAVMATTAILVALDYVGVIGVEFFVASRDGRPALLVNEIAPRVHNSGHWTEAVCITDQFEQHIRAICGWPLGDTTRLADVVMENLLGEEIHRLEEHLPATRVHSYGKREARFGRKMGHINRVIKNGQRND